MRCLVDSLRRQVSYIYAIVVATIILANALVFSKEIKTVTIHRATRRTLEGGQAWKKPPPPELGGVARERALL